MKSIRLHENKEFSIDKLDIKELKEEELLVRVHYCGICGSDLSRYFDGAKYYPIVLGHEYSGTVVDAYDKNDQLIGKNIVGLPLSPCFECVECKQGQYYACNNYLFMGSGKDGAFQTFVSVKRDQIIEIPKKLELDKASFVEPLAVALHAINRINISQLDVVNVYGCGTIGLLIIQSLKARGILNINAIDIEESKLDLSKQYGVCNTFNSKEDEIPEADISFECTGNSFIQSSIIDKTLNHGSICYVGTSHGDVNLKASTFEKILRKEINITGSWMSYTFPFPGSEWNYAISLLEKDLVNVDSLMNKYSMDEISKAFNDMKYGKTYKGILKIEE